MLTDIIKEKNKTVTGVAKHIGKTRAQVHNYNNGKHMPSARTAMAMADYLEVPVADILNAIDK